MVKKLKKENVFVKFVLISDYAFISENGKLGVIGVFDLLGVPSFPAGHPEMFLVANIKGKENSGHEVKLRLEDPSGEDLLSTTPPLMRVHLSSTGSGNLIQRFLNLSFKRPGLHKFIVFVDGHGLGSAGLSVIKIQQSDQGANKDGKISRESN